MRNLFIFLLVLALLPACAPTATPMPTDLPATAAPTATTAPESGITGQVTIGPACPVVRIDQPCPDNPFQATLTVQTASGSQVTQFSTDENGNFRIALAPGDYILHPEAPDAMTRAQDVPFSVASGEFTTVNITYDNGLR